MDPIASMAAAALRARVETLDMLANNLANAGTDGYKADYDRYQMFAAPDAVGADGGPADSMPDLEHPWTDFSQGTLRPTGNTLDVALSGPGFFVVKSPSGPLYTRNGSFHLTPAGDVVTADGYAVRLTDGTALKTASSAPLEINSDGAVRQAGQTLGSLDLADFSPGAVLVKQGRSYFKYAGPANAVKRPGQTLVSQGKVETSNAGTAEAAVRLVGIMRQFEALQKAITLSGEMDRHTVEEVAKVGA